MGPSGSGKTTLLNILCKRIKCSHVENIEDGRVKANSLEYDFDQFGKFANYVMQKDILHEILTVRETL